LRGLAVSPPPSALAEGGAFFDLIAFTIVEWCNLRADCARQHYPVPPLQQLELKGLILVEIDFAERLKSYRVVAGANQDRWSQVRE
jgi:hypothetical protein